VPFRTLDWTSASTWKRHFIPLALLTGLSLLVRYWVDRIPIDDAYITFRHSVRLFQGLGWGYNNGSAVIATSTPLWTLILVPVSRYLPEVARHLGILLDSAVPFVLYCSFYAVSKYIGLSLLVGFLYIFSPDTALCAPSGMEIPLFNLLLCLSVLSLQREWLKSATLCAALLPLVRLDGLIFVALAWPFYLKKRSFPHIIFQVIPILLWYLYKAGLGEGSLLPSSLSGKIATYSHYEGPSLGRLLGVLDYWTSLYFKTLNKDWIVNLPRALLWLGLTVGGASVLVKKSSPAFLLPLFSLLYSIACVLVSVPLFSWYYGPPTPGICIGVGAALFLGAKEILPVGDGVKRLLPRLGTAFLLLMALGGVLALYEFNHDRPPAWLGRVLFPNERERANYECAKMIRRSLEEKPLVREPRILVHDLGVLGFYLPEATLVDSAGIVSPEVVDYYREKPNARRFDFREELIDYVAPDFFVCAARHGPLKESWDSILLEYEEVGRATGETWAYPYVIVCRKRERSPD